MYNAVNVSLQDTAQTGCRYAEILCQLNQRNEIKALPVLCPAVIELLSALQSVQIPVGIISNSPLFFVDRLLQLTNLCKFHFLPIIGSAGNKATRLRDFAKGCAIECIDMVYIGDSFTDFKAATVAGVNAINVNTGAYDWQQSGLPYVENLAAIAHLPHLPLLKEKMNR